MVYIDNFYETGGGKFGRMKMSHMVADTTGELLTMADTIGVKRKWIQDAGTYREHFDVCMAARLKAIKAGAQAITWREIGTLLTTRQTNQVTNNTK